MDLDAGDWSGELRFGPFDGATARLSVRPSELPRAVILTFVVEDETGEPMWHSYALDREGSTLHYLGGDRNAELAPPLLDAPVEGPGLLDVPQDGLTRRFYELLFERHPEVRELFGADLHVQAHMLGTALRLVLEHIGEPDWLTHGLGALGAQHAEWGVTAPMYDAFRECMVTAMAEHTGEAWNPQLEAAWDATFQEICSLMLGGAAAAAELRSGF